MELILVIKREKMLEHYKNKGYIKEGENNEILYEKVYDEVLVFLGKIKEIIMTKKEKLWKYDIEKDEYMIKISLDTTFSNPLNVLTDVNRNYSHFKVQLEINQNKKE